MTDLWISSKAKKTSLYNSTLYGEIDMVQFIFTWCVLYSLEQKLSVHIKSWKIKERNLLVNTYFQKKCDLPDKSRLQLVQLHAV